MGKHTDELTLETETARAKHLAKITGSPWVVVFSEVVVDPPSGRLWVYHLETLKDYPLPYPHKIVYLAKPEDA